MSSWRSARIVAAGSAAALVSSVVVAVPAVAGAGLSPFEAVDQFIGTEMDTSQNKSNDAYGNTFPGAAAPFGMVQSSPTTYKPGNPLVGEKGGYEYTAGLIRGFGMTRYSGSGCTGRFGGYEFPTIPYAGELRDGALPVNPSTDIKNYYLRFQHGKEVAEPGYYSVGLDNGVAARLTASPRTAVSQFDFPDGENSTLILDASGPNNRTFGTDVQIDPKTRTVSGWLHGADLCDNGNYYRAYFSTTYDQNFASYGVWKDGQMSVGGTHVEKSTDDVKADYRHDTGAWITFADGAKVTAKTGLSFVSVDNAAENRDVEVGRASFGAVRARAARLWRQALGTVEVSGGTDEQSTKFYTALYHSLLHPNVRDDVNREYLGYDGKVHRVERGRHFYKNFAGSGWDMYRSQAQLIALTFPEVANDINDSIVKLTEQTGSWAPGAARMQGDNLQVILSTLDDMGATRYDRGAALRSMTSTQKLPATATFRTDGYQYFAAGLIENRKGDFATSRVLEYAIDDFAIAQLARRLGDKVSYQTFMERAQNWMNVFDPVTRHIRPRERTGFDRNFDLRVRDDGQGRGQFNQSTGYQYGWLVPHNLSTLIGRRGGTEASMKALDVLMEDLDAGAYTKTGNYLSNQPAFSTPWVYNWLQAPEKTTDVLYRAVREMYDTSPSGLPGNDDQGSLSAWYVFANLGVYPAIYGTGDLVIGAPMFDRIVIAPFGSRRVIRIDAAGVQRGKRYVAGMRVNGRPQTRSWVDARLARHGGTLDFRMSATPGRWGTGAQDIPPSYTDGADARNNVGTTPDGRGNLGSLDLSDWSLSRESLAAAGAKPGAELPLDGTGIVFTWPDTAPGRPDNWIPHGQRIPLDGAPGGAVSFLGLATNGPATGTATVEYTDGSTQQIPVEFADWAKAATAGNTELINITGRNNANGSTGSGAFRVFATRPVTLNAGKRVRAVTLPQASDQGIMHIFDVATSK
ncbi:GH92 family glycosyl hydrolase [Actinomadura sp. 9N215]|uniref:GH92 family glycosyl hydrolase n=1 Tax=Actinomadura sp. 9N215 TaxID=3375150 RepID=UPI0037951BEB